MTRLEEIWESFQRYKLVTETGNLSEGDYIAGAEWADEHPKKGLVNINNVCKWLKENVSGYSHNDLGIEYMINDFKQAMSK